MGRSTFLRCHKQKTFRKPSNSTVVGQVLGLRPPLRPPVLHLESGAEGPAQAEDLPSTSTGIRQVFVPILVLGLFCASSLSAASVLRVCADPNNMPYSNQKEEGMENHLAKLLANDLGMQVQFIWWAQSRNFIDKSINAGVCDALMGVPATIPDLAVTRPYYTSTYVWVEKRGHAPEIDSLYDPRLKSSASERISSTILTRRLRKHWRRADSRQIWSDSVSMTIRRGCLALLAKVRWTSGSPGDLSPDISPIRV